MVLTEMSSMMFTNQTLLDDKGMVMLMEQMGISASAASKHEQLKAPMPGKVLEIKVSVGQEVKQGEPLLILEAMKMENVLKASHDVTVAEINIKQGDTVDKGQVLLVFE